VQRVRPRVAAYHVLRDDRGRHPTVPTVRSVSTKAGREPFAPDLAKGGATLILLWPWLWPWWWCVLVGASLGFSGGVVVGAVIAKRAPILRCAVCGGRREYGRLCERCESHYAARKPDADSLERRLDLDA